MADRTHDIAEAMMVRLEVKAHQPLSRTGVLAELVQLVAEISARVEALEASGDERTQRLKALMSVEDMVLHLRQDKNV